MSLRTKQPSDSWKCGTFMQSKPMAFCYFFLYWMKSIVVSLKVRCAAVFALGTFVGNSAERTDHSTTIDHNVAMMLAQLINDGSPVVRKVSWLLNVWNWSREFNCPFSSALEKKCVLQSFSLWQQNNWVRVAFWLKCICKNITFL